MRCDAPAKALFCGASSAVLSTTIVHPWGRVVHRAGGAHLPVFGSGVRRDVRLTFIKGLYRPGLSSGSDGELPFLFLPKPGWLAALWRIISEPAGTVAAWCLGGAVTAGYVLYAATRSSVIRSFAFRPAAWGHLLALRLVAIPMAFVTGFFEEVFYRKIVMVVAANHASSPLLQTVSGDIRCCARPHPSESDSGAVAGSIVRDRALGFQIASL
jgi:hypothetical protein